MNYLSKTVSQYKCHSCERVGEADQWVRDDYIGLCCGECGEEVRSENERPAKWWSVGVYETGRAYGGPEEGGWWYDTGSRCDNWTVRGFQDMALAQAYIEELRLVYKDDKNIGVQGFTEKLPEAGYPERKPVYC